MKTQIVTCIFAAGMAAAVSYGQTAPARAGDSPAPDAPIELSPFTVKADQDVGYLAANTLAGSRLNTRLKDTAASISVFTEEFLRDVGAYDLSDALVYANNLQLDMDDAGSFGDSPGGNPTIEFHQQYRVRGIAATVARNYFKWSVPTDTYNVERVEDSRGPNSVLFGVGSAGGVINVATKQAQLGRTIRRVSFGADDYDSWRVAADYNESLLSDRAAVRLNAVWNRTNSFRHHSFSESRRVHLAMKYRIASRTVARVEFEKGKVIENKPRNEVLFDSALPWVLSGRPTFSLTAPNTDFAGLGSRLGSNQPRYIGNTGALVNMTGQILTSGEGAVLRERSLRDDSINTGGPGQERTNHFDAFSAFVEHQLGRKTFAELAFNHQEYNFSSFDPQRSQYLYGEANAALPGTLGPNPFAGGLFLETFWRNFLRHESSDTGRLMISTEHDFGKWGLYRVAGLGEYEKRRYDRATRWEVWEGAPFNASPEVTANRVVRRTYVTENDWASYYVNGPLTDGLISNLQDPITGRTFSSKWVVDGTDDDPSVQKSFLAGLQASYFDGRLVAGTGYRYDHTRTLDRTRVRNPVTNEWQIDYSRATVIENTGRTYTLGVVGHVTRQISLLYNQSKNIAIPPAAILILPDSTSGPPPRGEGQDYGLAFDLFDGRVYARAVRYTTSSRGEIGFRFGGTNGAATTNSTILNALRGAGLISQADLDARSIQQTGATYDRTSEGYEFSLTANPTRNWRLQANWSITDGYEENVGMEVVDWWNEVKPFFLSFPQDLPTTGANTIATEIQEFEDTLQTEKSTEGVGLVGNRKHKLTFFTRYTFSTGRLKGLFVGGGYRYQGKMLVGRTTTTGELQYGPPVGEASFLLGYDFRLGQNRRLGLQLNINNLFDETDTIPTRYFANGDTSRVRREIPRAPRTVRLTGTFSF